MSVFRNKEFLAQVVPSSGHDHSFAGVAMLPHRVRNLHPKRSWLFLDRRGRQSAGIFPAAARRERMMASCLAHHFPKPQLNGVCGCQMRLAPSSLVVILRGPLGANAYMYVLQFISVNCPIRGVETSTVQRVLPSPL